MLGTHRDGKGVGMLIDAAGWVAHDALVLDDLAGAFLGSSLVVVVAAGRFRRPGWRAAA